MIERPVVEQFYYILETFPILWLYQQSIKYFAIYEEKINCEMEEFALVEYVSTSNASNAALLKSYNLRNAGAL